MFSRAAEQQAKQASNSRDAQAKARAQSNTDAIALKNRYSEILNKVKIINMPQQKVPLIRILNNMKNNQLSDNDFTLKPTVTNDVLESIEKMITAINNYIFAVNNIKNIFYVEQIIPQTREQAANDYNTLFDKISLEFKPSTDSINYEQSKLPILPILPK